MSSVMSNVMTTFQDPEVLEMLNNFNNTEELINTIPTKGKPKNSKK